MNLKGAHTHQKCTIVIWKMLPGLMSLSLFVFCIQMAESEIVTNAQRVRPAVEDHTRCHSLSSGYSLHGSRKVDIPLWVQCIHTLMAASNRITCHVTNHLKLLFCYLSMTTSSMYSNDLQSHQFSSTEVLTGDFHYMQLINLQQLSDAVITMFGLFRSSNLA